MNRNHFKPVNRSQRLAAIFAAVMVSVFLFDGVASISANYGPDSALATQGQVAQVAQAPAESGTADR